MKDLATFNGKFIDKAKVLKFIPAIDLKIELTPISELQRKYNIEGDFFYMPNQFWKHKNQQLVVKAVNEIVNVKNQNVLVLASGSLSDYRNNAYIENVVSQIETLNLTKNIKLLGVIPYVDVLSLMHFSIALINPSFSEGWSSTVEEAKQLKVSLILSNIPIHQEQTAELKGTVLFNPNDYFELADILLKYKGQKQYSETFDYKDEFKERQLRFGIDYQNIVLDLVDNK